MSEFRYAQTNLQLLAQLREAGFSEVERARVAAAYDLASRLFTGQFRCCGKTFLAHLVGTASIVARHGAREPVVAAALLHAAYDDGNFGSVWRRLTKAKRATVRAAAGEEAERLVASYHSLPWRRSEDRPALLRRLGDLQEDERTAVFIRMANELEEVLDGAFLYCGAARQEDMKNAVVACGEICRVLDMPDIGAEIEETYRRYSAAKPAAVLATARNGSYLLPAASLSTRPGLRLWALLRRPWEGFVPKALRIRIKAILNLAR